MWRALVLVVAWTCAGLWDISHIVEHAHSDYTAEPEIAAAAGEAVSLSLAAGEGHGHAHPPDGQPVLGNGRESRLEVPLVSSAAGAFVRVPYTSSWVPGTVTFGSGRIATSVAQPRAPPLF